MAAEPHSTTRRALLGAAAAVLVAPSPVIASAARQSRMPVQGTKLDLHVADVPRDDGTTWNRRLADYRRLAVRTKAQSESGAYRAAIVRYDRERVEIERHFGSWQAAWESKEGSIRCAAIFAGITKAENAYAKWCLVPTLRAAVELAQTPAPDLQALLVKIEIMREHELDTYESTRPVLEMLGEDVGRLNAARELAPLGHRPIIPASLRNAALQRGGTRRDFR